MCDCKKNNSNFNTFYNDYTDGTYANADGKGTSFFQGLIGGFLGTNEPTQAPTGNQQPTMMGSMTPPPATDKTWLQKNGLMLIGFGVLGAVITGVLIYKNRN
jgi:hypothetical protein